MMILTPKLIKGNTVPLCFMPDGRLICYQYGSIVMMNEGKVEAKFSLFTTIRERYFGRCRLLSRSMRLGVRTALAIDDDYVVLSIGNSLYELNVKTGALSEGYFCGDGIRPLVLSEVKGLDGFDDGIYFGGYLGNMDKKPVDVYRRTAKDKWDVVYTFKKGEINHVHTIVPDTYRQCLWIFTGDFDEASAIWKVSDNFRKVERVVCNDQRYRGCVVFAVPEGLLYATDAPFADDFIYLMDPQTYAVKELFPIDGSCIYGCQWKDNFVFSSTVEGDGRNTPKLEFLFGRKRGAGIKDEYVHMYMGNLKARFHEIYKEKKDRMPYYTFQFGVFKFPHGINNSNMLYFQPVATKINDQDLMAYSE